LSPKISYKAQSIRAARFPSFQKKRRGSDKKGNKKKGRRGLNFGSFLGFWEEEEVFFKVSWRLEGEEGSFAVAESLSLPSKERSCMRQKRLGKEKRKKKCQPHFLSLRKRKRKRGGEKKEKSLRRRFTMHPVQKEGESRFFFTSKEKQLKRKMIKKEERPLAKLLTFIDQVGGE